jgi:hypothetical protein
LRGGENGSDKFNSDEWYVDSFADDLDSLAVDVNRVAMKSNWEILGVGKHARCCGYTLWACQRHGLDPASLGGPQMVVVTYDPPDDPVAIDRRWTRSSLGTGAESLPTYASSRIHEGP